MADKEEGCIGCVVILAVIGLLKWAYDKLAPWVSTHVNETIGGVVVVIAIVGAVRLMILAHRAQEEEKQFDGKFPDVGKANELMEEEEKSIKLLEATVVSCDKEIKALRQEVKALIPGLATILRRKNSEH